MADIKTRDVVKGTIKTVDRAAIAERRMKQSYLLTKDKAKQFDKMSGASETEYASEQVEQKTETVAKHVVQRIDQKGRKGFEFTRGNIRTRMKGSDEKNKNFLRKRAKGSNDKKVQGDENALNKGFNLMGKKVDKTSKNKASKDIKTAKAPQKPINYIKSTIKDAEQTTETTRKTIAASSRVSKGVTQVAKSVTRTITSGAKTVAKATTKAVRATMTTAKMSVAAIAAGGWAAIVAIVVICLSALLLGSVFGIFFAGEDTGTGQTIQTVVHEINSDYDDKLMSIRDNEEYREKKRRNGTVYRDKQGNMGFGPFNWKARKLILRKLLETQQVMGYELITLDELKAIDEIWDQELDLSRRVLVELYEEITGKRLPWYDYKEPLIDNETVVELENLAKKNNVPEELIRNLLLSVYRNKNYSNQKILRDGIDRLLNQQWLHYEIIEEIENENQ